MNIKLLNKKYIILILFTLLYIQTAIGEDIIYPEKDATVDKWFSTNSYTSPIITYAGSDGTDFKRAFIEFSISNYSDSSTITDVKLYLYSNDENTAGEVYFQRLTQTWSEPITWNSQPTSYTSTNQASENIYSTYTWYEIDVTEQFKDAIDSENGYYGIRLTSEEDDSHEAAKFMSVHEANKPYLKISVTNKLSGYVTNDLENSVSTAAITLNNSGGSTTSNETGYYEITGISSGIYSISITEASHYDYSDTVTITNDTEKNILLTVNPAVTPTSIPVIAPPPVISIEIPTQEPTHALIEDTELTLFEEFIEKLNELSILITDLMGKASSWTFLLTSYIGALVSSVLIKGKEDDEESEALNVLLFGTLGWIVPLFINFTGLITLVTESFLLNTIVFAAFGFVIYTIGNVFNKN